MILTNYLNFLQGQVLFIFIIPDDNDEVSIILPRFVFLSGKRAFPKHLMVEIKGKGQRRSMFYC